MTINNVYYLSGIYTTFMQQPLVSIICLCYNHEKFVAEALRSVFMQTYANIELIVIDDVSKDDSVKIIGDVLDDENAISLPKPTENISNELQNSPVFIQNEQNLGNCRSFNLGLAIAQGKYVIDLAGDDVLLDDRVEKQVQLFESLSEDYAVVFSNALNISEEGAVLNYHYAVDKQGKSKVNVPQGDVYQEVLQRYFINTATMMMRTKILKAIGGYDETLSYEDFDFWVRTSRHYLYYYQDEVTTLKRVVKNSLSSAFYLKKFNPHLASTLQVFYKALEQNTTDEENKLLANNVFYHLRLAYYTQNFDLVFSFQELLKELKSSPKLAQIFVRLARYRIKTYWIYRRYLKIKGWLNKRLK